MKNLIFFGSDQYSAIVLETLIEFKILDSISVITDRPKPKDKDQLIEPNPVEKLAITHKLKLFYYPSIKDEMINLVDTLKNWSTDSNPTGLCASFDHLLPTSVIEIFNGQLYNLHPSILPQYRNVSPVQYAIALGDKVTGITLFRISAGIDNGEIISQVEESISIADTTPILTPRLFIKGAKLFMNFMQNIKSTKIFETANQLIFTKRLTRDSGFIEWSALQKLINNQPINPNDTINELLKLRLTVNNNNSLSIFNDLVRSFTPWPTLWSLVPTKKGELRVNIESVLPELKLKIAGKPNSISFSDFSKYYL